MKKSKKITVSIIAFFGIIAFVTSVFLAGKNTLAQNSLIAVEDTTSGISLTNDDASLILSLLNKMQNIKLNTEIFSDPLFLGLNDYTVELVQEPKKRPNPFAPIGKDALIVASSSLSTL